MNILEVIRGWQKWARGIAPPEGASTLTLLRSNGRVGDDCPMHIDTHTKPQRAMPPAIENQAFLLRLIARSESLSETLFR
jgi:hypothetical protein